MSGGKHENTIPRQGLGIKTTYHIARCHKTVKRMLLEPGEQDRTLAIAMKKTVDDRTDVKVIE